MGVVRRDAGWLSLPLSPLLLASLSLPSSLVSSAVVVICCALSLLCLYVSCCQSRVALSVLVLLSSVRVLSVPLCFVVFLPCRAALCCAV